MDAQSTLAAITSAYAAHGPIIRLISDNGTNFTGASNILHRAQENLKDFRWSFIPVRSAWMGGMWERMIKEVKRSLKEVINNKWIELTSFKIAMFETMHRINCRPLTHLSISHEDEEILTPHHLAKNKPGWPLLPSAHTLKMSGKGIDERTYYAKGQKLADMLTRRFYEHYLTELTQRTKWNKKNPNLKLGDLVLIIDPTQTRSTWLRGIINSFVPGRDGIARIAEVKTCYATTTFCMPETNRKEHHPRSRHKKPHSSRRTSSPSPRRPRRDVSKERFRRFEDLRDVIEAKKEQKHVQFRSLKKNSNLKKRREQRETSTLNNPIRHAQKDEFEDVPLDVNIPEFLLLLSRTLRSVIGISREFNYDEEVAATGPGIYIYVTQQDEVEAAVAHGILFDFKDGTRRIRPFLMPLTIVSLLDDSIKSIPNIQFVSNITNQQFNSDKYKTCNSLHFRRCTNGSRCRSNNHSHSLTTSQRNL
ncbi:hypothetical protein PVAND_014305 [Polypedilum vanderplanki]|uniref:DUF5641 domain-containing protein n=1 Tax=Polypedilum vanderplanki TaxID=319348 RepID=A0A9J6CTN4_POLVA|nr:hypothetical protein PVAND_014305 [Polypedilum vanderplanki]